MKELSQNNQRLTSINAQFESKLYSLQTYYISWAKDKAKEEHLKLNEGLNKEMEDLKLKCKEQSSLVTAKEKELSELRGEMQ